MNAQIVESVVKRKANVISRDILDRLVILLDLPKK